MPTLVCPDCNGTGWKIVEREEVSGAERCACAAARRAEGLEAKANIPPHFRGKDFGGFNIGRDEFVKSGELGHAHSMVHKYVKEFPDPNRPGLLIMGPHGTGKTHLAVAALRAIMAKGYGGLFVDYQGLLEQIQQGYDPQSNASDREAFRLALEAEVLLIDDLGKRRVSDWVEDTVTAIITHRYNNKKPLIATTNLIDPDAGYAVVERRADGGSDYSATTVENRIGPRARSRLFEMCRIVKMPPVKDFRVEKRAVL